MTRDKQKKELIYLLSKTDALSKERIAEFLLDNGVEVKEPLLQKNAVPTKLNHIDGILQSLKEGHISH